MEPVNQRNHRVDDVSPQSLTHLAGQHGVRAQLAVALEAAWADGRRLEHALLIGPPGLGKRQTAAVAAAEMACAFHDVSAESIEDASDLNALLLSACDKELIHISEAHALPGPLQAALLLAIDRRAVLLDAEVCPHPLPVSDFSLLLSTTDESELSRPLRDRMSLHLRFDWYPADDLAEIVRRRARALGWRADDDVAPLIAQRARGTPRAALTLLQATYRWARAAGEHALTATHLHRACGLAEVDPQGSGDADSSHLSPIGEGLAGKDSGGRRRPRGARQAPDVTGQADDRGTARGPRASWPRRRTGKSADARRRRP